LDWQKGGFDVDRFIFSKPVKNSILIPESGLNSLARFMREKIFEFEKFLLSGKPTGGK